MALNTRDHGIASAIVLVGALSLMACGGSNAGAGDGQGASEVVKGDPLADAELAHSPLVFIATGPDTYCSGTLVGRRTVLTAAHCIHESTAWLVKIGYEKSGSLAAKTLRVTAAVAHPKYDVTPETPYAQQLPAMRYDVGLLRLENDAPAEKPRAKLLDPSEHHWIADHRGTASALVMGFGATTEAAENLAAAKGVITLADPAATKEPVSGTSVAKAFGIEHDEAIVADFGSGAQMCYGDSGGPVFEGTTVNQPSFTVVGVNSFILDESIGTRVCNRGSVHPAVSAPENAAFLSAKIAEWER